MLKQKLELERLRQDLEGLQSKDQVPEDPVEFAEKWFEVRLTEYQRELAKAFMKPYLTIVVR